MKKIIFLLSLSSLVFTACSKPDTNTHESNTAPDQPMTQATTAEPAATMSDTAETSLDWPGEYKGVFPCADCQGIETELELKADKTYELKQKYLGKGKNSEFKVKGTFSFDADNPAMISLDQAGENRKFFIGENFVEARDIKSEKLIDSKMNYKLQKDAN
ncbi:copper resistance protein NlpE N-terminal domain-containing protein [Acinetobacter sp. SM34]|uniref:copper resistance protein NlpE n=1 Tax=unclassified Acinetobacter TaxID=196816 RepID=UPI001EDBCA39|nr:copper resistance protein NlpE N-terminal domain-containing protein [Acinetobacter sp. SM34]